MSFFKPAEPTRPRENGDTSDRPRQRRRTDAPQQQYLTELKTQTLEGHFSLRRRSSGYSDWARSVSFSPDGTKVASGSYDNTVKLWDVTSGSELRTFEGHSNWVRSVSFSPDGTKVASGSYPEVKLWDVTSGECLQTLEGHSYAVESVSFSPDGTKVASGSVDKTVKLWDVTSGECLQTLEGHSSDAQCVVFSRWDEGCVGVSGQYGEAVGFDEWRVSADAGGAFLACEECVVFSRWDEGCVGVFGQYGEVVGCDEWGVSKDT